MIDAYAIIEQLADADFESLGASFEGGDKMPHFRFSPEAQELFYEWWTELETKKLRGPQPSIIEQHLGRYRSLMPSLALIFHLIDVVDGAAPGPISLRAAQLAAAWCEYLESHALRLYGMVADLAPRAAMVLSHKIKRGDIQSRDGRFTVREVYRKGWELLTDKEVIEDACLILEGAGWIRDVTENAETGRRSSPTYLVHPTFRSA